jgi:tRNA (cytidine/uridine-2'-O-)-methyltransferase
MFHVVLFEPEIPPNTGNVIRLCANAGANLHLIEPLGFSLDDKHLRRAGMDYRDLAHVTRHANLATLLATLDTPKVYACTTRGGTRHTDAQIQPGDVLLFGPETRGLPTDVLAQIPSARQLRIPMCPDNRSLNLSNAVAVILYEAWRQNQFTGAG